MRDTLFGVRHAMYWINLTAVIFVSGVFFLTPYRVGLFGQSVAFSDNLSYLPEAPWIAPLLSILGMLLLLIPRTVVLKQTRHASGRRVFVLGAIELVLCLMVVLALHMDYNGVLLLLVVDIIDLLHRRERAVFLGSMIALYLLTSLDVLQPLFHFVPFESYLGYYLPQAQQIMRSTRGLLMAVNSIMFITFMVILVGQRTEENAYIRRLNDELGHANDKLRVMNDKLTIYSEEIESMTQTRERNRLAREIHDTIGHSLTGIIAGADACITMLDISPEMARHQMELIASTARQGINEVRRSVNALRPDALERLSLPDALETLAAEMQKTSNTKILLQLDREALALSADEEDTVYRIVQESITNAIRHGQATQVTVKITFENHWLKLTIKDDGKGCQTIQPGFGLRHMRERLHLLGGTLQVGGEDGFLVVARLPVRWGKKYD